MFNENQVRAAAGLTMALGAVAFAYANFAKVFMPIQVVTTFFFVDFLIRVTVGIKYSPDGRGRRLADEAPGAAVGVGQAQALRVDARPDDVARP